jgi:hypothetical protein
MISHNEAYAIAALKAYASAQNTFIKGGYSFRAAAGQFTNSYTGSVGANGRGYSSTVKSYAYPFPDLYAVSADPNNPNAGGIALINQTFANAYSPETAWNGYWFMHLVDSPNPNQYDLLAVPALYGVTGRNSFYINQQGVVRQKDFGRSLKANEIPEGENPMWNDSGWIDARQVVAVGTALNKPKQGDTLLQERRSRVN